MSKIVDMVKALAAAAAEKNGCELWDAEYVKEAGNWFLRVYIDRPGGVSIKHCEDVSHEMNPLLDEREDMFPNGYTFEVSSAGAERWLRGPSDYGRFEGHLAEVKLYKARDGKKTFLGNLAGEAEGGVLLDVDGERRRFEKTEVAGVRLRISI